MLFHHRLLPVHDIHSLGERVEAGCYGHDALAVDGVYIIYRCALVADGAVDGRLVEHEVEACFVKGYGAVEARMPTSAICGFDWLLSQSTDRLFITLM